MPIIEQHTDSTVQKHRWARKERKKEVSKKADRKEGREDLTAGKDYNRPAAVSAVSSANRSSPSPSPAKAVYNGGVVAVL